MNNHGVQARLRVNNMLKNVFTDISFMQKNKFLKKPICMYVLYVKKYMYTKIICKSKFFFFNY